MCGRFTNKMTWQEIHDLYDITNADFRPNLRPNYNIAPTHIVPVIRPGAEGRELALMRWGFEEPWAKSSIINATAEKVATSRVFKSSFEERRCLVPADGFFEWRRVNGRKQPIYFTLRDHHPFAFAGLWERWVASDGHPVESCAILTTEPNALVLPVHDRMPLILEPAGYDAWLAHDSDPERDLVPLFRPYSGGQMESYPVSPMVNSAEPDAPECIERQEYEEQGELW